jgi:hypothetical protein
MHPIEAIIADCRTRGVVPDLVTLGGVEAIISEMATLTRSPFVPDIVALMIAADDVATAKVDSPAAKFIVASYIDADADLALHELSNLLSPLSDAAPHIAGAVFSGFLDRLGSRAGSAPARRVVLFGALSLALGHRSRELRLAAALLETDTSDIDPTAIAKTMGVVWSRVREEGLSRRLEDLCVAGCAEAAFEVGCVKLVLALEQSSTAAMRRGLEEARSVFRRSCELAEVMAEADLVALSIEMLEELLDRRQPLDQSQRVEQLKMGAFALAATRNLNGLHGWQQAHRERMICWGRLALTVDALSRRLWEPSWWQPAAVIGGELLRVYALSKTFLREPGAKGLETLVRPVIETSVFEASGQLHLVREWLRHNAENELAPQASKLIAQVEALGATALATGGSATGRDAATAATPSRDVVAGLMSSMADGLDSTIPAALRNTLVDWLSQIEEHSDLLDNQRARVFVGQIIFFTLRFLQWCTDRASPSEEMSAYLFDRRAKLPHENVLQRHYIAMLSGWMGQMGVEVAGVSGGRCDVVFSFGADRFVVEVKREQDDAASEALFRAYGAQTEEYQNASWRLGILLVLDLTRAHGKGLHVRDAVASRSILRDDESAPRTVFLVSIAGRRLVPSDQTKAARKDS